MSLSSPIEQSRSVQEVLDPIYQRLTRLEKSIGDLAPGDGRGAALACLTAETTLVSSVSEATLGSLTIPALTLGTANLIRVDFYFTYLNNTGAGRALTLRLKYGGQTLGTFGPYTLAASATRRGGMLSAVIKGNGSVSAQSMLGQAIVGAVFGAGTVNLVEDWQSGTGTVNSAADQSLVVTGQHGFSDATLDIRSIAFIVTGPMFP